MYYRDPKCVFVSDSLGEAHAVVAFLAGQDIESQVMDELTLGGFEGLTAWLPAKVSLRGLEVWVIEPADADRARQVIAQNEEVLRREKTNRARHTNPVTAVCDECGKSTTFPPAEQGTVQDCPHCGAYLDVPDPENELEAGDGDELEEIPEPE